MLWGWILVGWGLFDLVEGLLDHQILGIHHVHGGPYQLCRTAPEIRYGVGTVHYEEFPGPRVVPPAWSPPTLGWWLGP